MLVSELCKENLTDEIVDRVLFEGISVTVTNDVFLHVSPFTK